MIPILGDFISEAWTRSTLSFANNMEAYHERMILGLQPKTSFINMFDVYQQFNFLCISNACYLIITMLLFSFMKTRKTGFRLRWVLMIYDGINVLVASYVAFSTIHYKLFVSPSLICNTVNNEPEGHKIAYIFILFYFQKYFEFFDTWFFILRKSFRQVTFLHLFHHSSITVVVGSILTFDYNGDMYLPILLNSFNHALIYSHYLLATLGYECWWSPYLTSMQLFQFCLIFGQSLIAYCIGPSCGSPDFAKVLMIVYMGSMVALFGHFFLQKYVFRKPVSNLDLCGVVKRPLPSLPLSCSYCGIVNLNRLGSCLITLPEDFPDQDQITKLTLVPKPFIIVYTLTPIGSAMPNLHISKEVSRHNTLDEFEIMKPKDLPKENLTRRTKNSSIPSHSFTETKSTKQFRNDDFADTFYIDDEGKENVECIPEYNIWYNADQQKVISTLPKPLSTNDIKYTQNDRVIDGPSSNSGESQITALFKKCSNGITKTFSASQSDLVDQTSQSGETSPRNNSYDQHSGKFKEKDSSESSKHFSFIIGGGLPTGKVSWTIKVVSNNIDNALSTNNQQSLSLREGDWRALS